MNAQQISVAEILKRAESLEIKNFEKLYTELTSIRAKKNGIIQEISTEVQLLEKINTEFDSKKWERLKYLDWKLESSALTDKEEIESLKLAEAYEKFSVDRLKNIAQLASIRKISLDILTDQLGLNVK